MNAQTIYTKQWEAVLAAADGTEGHPTVTRVQHMVEAMEATGMMIVPVRLVENLHTNQKVQSCA